ncbi:tetratricopeptide repeat protein [Culturomica massiliensis]|uniref:tetratricopeptide repeat protein n=1 Tax=Culturomica massiliensis TaxID=1841857 RepID=UPI002665C548|nr:tetratricopeptide repeat protein [Culturomica massiliensis]
MKITLTLIIFLGLFISCNFNSSHFRQLEKWDLLLKTDPFAVKDSLKNLDPDLLNKEEKAYFYLLEAASGDKTGTRLKNDSTLQFAYQYYQNQDDFLKLARIQFYLGEHLYLQGKDVEQAYDLLKQAEINYDKSSKDDPHILGLIYYWLGQIQNRQGNLSEAESYCNNALNLYSKLKDSISVTYAHRQLGILYIKQKEFRKAKEQLSEARRIIRKIDDGQKTNITDLHLSILNYQSYLHQEIKDYDTAINFSKQCISIMEKRDFSKKSPLYLLITKIYQYKENTDSCRLYCMKMLNAAEKKGNLYNIANGYSILFQLEETEGNYKTACELRGKYNEVKDKIHSQNKNADLKELENKYKLEKQEKENLATKNRSLGIIMVIFIIALVACIIALYFMWNHRKLKVRNTRLTEEIKKTQWGFALSKELINDNNDTYTEIERVLYRNVNIIPTKVYDEFQDAFRHQKSNYSDRLFAALMNIENRFIEKLKLQCPDISIEEILLASMLRHQWNISDIAQIFRISFDALKKRKYRLKLKLVGNDNPKVTLEEYLSQL